MVSQSNRGRIVLGICVIALWAGRAWADVAPGSESRPHIILCMADDQGWGDMAYQGHPVLKTPNLDAMSEAGLRFDHFYAAAPVCSPTRGSVLTGRHPNRFGCFLYGHALRPQEITIAEVLKEAGYVTGHFGKWHLGSVQKGSPVNPGTSGFDEWFSAFNYFDNDPILSREGTAVQTYGESSMVTMEAATEFIRKHADSSFPTFTVIWFGSPHNPQRASEENRKLYEDQPEQLQHFYGEISGIDQAMGKLRATLRELKIQDNTLVWYCSDNGGLPKLGVTGGRGNKGRVYEGGLRVPAIIEWPAKIAKPRRLAMPANTVDIFPTLLEIVGIEPNAKRPLDGISLVSAIEGKVEKRSRPMGFWHDPIKGIRTPSHEWMTELLAAQKEGKEVEDNDRIRKDADKIKKQYPKGSYPDHAAWLDWPWKLHRIENKKGNVKWELYDLVNDPMEATNVYADQTDRVESMRVAMNIWLASVVDSLNGKDYE